MNMFGNTPENEVQKATGSGSNETVGPLWSDAGMLTKVPIFTIGHSTHSPERFAELLSQYKIDFLIDVRTSPYSRRNPQFNKTALKKWLRSFGVGYGHMPNEFGARHQDPALLGPDRRVDFERVRASNPFRHGMARIKSGLAQGHRIALMCAEADPFDCHRFAMISYQLVREQVEVKHILKDGRLIDNAVLERRLEQVYGISIQADIFCSPETREAQLERAYRLRSRDMAYSPAVPE